MCWLAAQKVQLPVVASRIFLQICRQADGYQPHLVSPERGIKRLVQEAMEQTAPFVHKFVDEIHLVLMETVRLCGRLLLLTVAYTRQRGLPRLDKKPAAACNNWHTSVLHVCICKACAGAGTVVPGARGCAAVGAGGGRHWSRRRQGHGVFAAQGL
jgi:hypothetical protein